MKKLAKSEPQRPEEANDEGRMVEFAALCHFINKNRPKSLFRHSSFVVRPSKGSIFAFFKGFCSDQAACYLAGIINKEEFPGDYRRENKDHTGE